MKRSVLILALACLASRAIAAPAEPVNDEQYLALKDLAVEVGVTATIVGSCERYIDRKEVDQYVARLGRPEDDPIADKLRTLWLTSYAQGRGMKEADDLTAESCQRLVDRQAALMSAAQRRLAAARTR